MSTLKSKVLLALRWSAAARFSAQLITWCATIFVIRLLDPADYGLMAMCEFLFAVLLLLSSRGLGAALVQSKELSEIQIRQMFGAVILVNMTLMALQWFGAPLLAEFYGEPRVVPVTRILAVGFVFVSLQTVPYALLVRDIEFKRKAIVELTASILAITVVVSTAIAGWGVWSLVAGRTVQLAAETIGLNLARPIRFLPLFSISASRRLIVFGGLYTVTTVLWYLYNRADVFVGGRYLDVHSLGIYAVAMHLAALVVVKAMPLINEVGLPAYSRIQDEPELVRGYFVKVFRIISLVVFPALLGLAAVAPEFVRVVLGPKYEEAIVPLVLLCSLMPLRLLSNLFPSAVLGVGRPRIAIGNNVAAFLVMPAAFLVGAQHGTVGLCLAWLVAFPIVLLYQTWSARRALQFRFADLAAAAGPPLLASLGMVGCLLLAKKTALGGQPPIVQLPVLVVMGAVVYGVTVLCLLRGRLTEARSMLLDRE